MKYVHSSFFSINMINGPVTLVLNDSVASCNPKEALTLLSMEWLHLLRLDR